MLRETRRSWLAALGLLVGIFLLGDQAARGGGPLLVGGPGFGIEGQSFVWTPTSMPIQYRTDGGNLGSLGNASANSRVSSMFGVWQAVPTAAISFGRAGAILPTGVFSGGDVDTVPEFDAVDGSCVSGAQSPIIYDASGTLFSQLVGDPNVIGFAGPCALNSSTGHILSAIAALNGRFQDGIDDGFFNFELTASEFDAAFIHEFGHFSGLDHSQINLDCLLAFSTECPSSSDAAFGLPTMFPFLLSLEETSGVHPGATLATDDIAWVSSLYPETGNSFGTISGAILFSDGTTPVQGGNVIAQREDNPATPEDESIRNQVSVVSGYRFTGNLGQDVTATHLPCIPASACPGGFAANNSGGSRFGSRQPAVLGTFDLPVAAGTYRVLVEGIFGGFAGGSGVGPVNPPLQLPGPGEFWNTGESADDSIFSPGTSITVSQGATISSIDIILNSTPPRFDAFEGPSARLWWRGLLQPWIRRELPARRPQQA